MTEPTNVRTALLEAAYDEVVSGSWERTRMADVARTAGVSRQTLYNEFGTKDALAQALAEQHTQALLDGVDARLAEARSGTDPIDVLRDAVEWVLDRAHEDPLVKTILVSSHETASLLPLITTQAEPVLLLGSAAMLAYFTEHWPTLPKDRLRHLSDSMIRLTVSHVVLSTEPTETTARVVSSLAALVLSAPQPQEPDHDHL